VKRHTRRAAVTLGLAIAAGAGCRTGQPIYDSSHSDHSAKGTIAGILRAGSKDGDPIPGRRLVAVDLASGQRYPVTTSVTGGFSIAVPPGKYRLEVELQEGERVLREPGIIDINKSDLDANLDVVLGR
jgi:hypothetical protein